MADDYERILEIFKETFTDIPLDTIRSNLTSIIQKLVYEPLENNILTEKYSIASNFIKLIIEKKLIDINYLLSSLIQFTRNYVGLFLIGMVIRLGANPNVYYHYPQYGNIHILCILSLRSLEFTDPYFRHIIQLLKELGSNIDYPAINLKNYDNSDLDIGYVEQVTRESRKWRDPGFNVKEFIQEQGKLPDEELKEYLETVSDDQLINFVIASDNKNLFLKVSELEFFKENILVNNEAILQLFLNFSTANSLTIVNEITNKVFPNIDNLLINTQTIPIYASVISMDYGLFSLLAKKGTLIKYISITQLIAQYKDYKKKGYKLYENNFKMLLEAVNIGSDIDLYQFDLLTSVYSADYKDIEAIKKAYSNPKWKKLCAVIKNDDQEARPEIKQIAFELNLDFNQNEKFICNKLKQISLMDKNQYLEAAVDRQEDRITAELSSTLDFSYEGKPARSRCSSKSMIIKNPYAYNDTRMAFYKDEEGEIWCFTSDTFSNLIYTRKNHYTGKNLPDKFIETLKAQVNILRNLGLFLFDNTIKDTLKDYFERSTINNKKTDYSYNTVVKCLSLYGLSEEKLNSLSEISLGETILNEICDVKINFLDLLTPKHQVILTTRVIYSLSKKLKNPAEFYETIGRAIIGDVSYEDEEFNEEGDLPEQENDNYGSKDEDESIEEYLSLLE